MAKQDVVAELRVRDMMTQAFEHLVNHLITPLTEHLDTTNKTLRGPQREIGEGPAEKKRRDAYWQSLGKKIRNGARID